MDNDTASESSEPVNEGKTKNSAEISGHELILALEDRIPRDFVLAGKEKRLLDMSVWQYPNYYPEITELTFKNCRHLGLIVDNRHITNDFSDINLQSLAIRNISSLEIKSDGETYILPKNVTLEDIRMVGNIPKHTFNNILPNSRILNLHIIRTTIGTIETDGIYLNDIEELLFEWVRIQQINFRGFNIDNGRGNVTFKTCSFDYLQSNSIQTSCYNVTFFQCIFRSIDSQTIVGTMNKFHCTHCQIGTISSYGISISAKEVAIEKNKINYLGDSALEGIKPGVLFNTSQTTPRYYYEFSGNHVAHIANNGLHPNLPAYHNVDSDIKVSENSIFDLCHALKWQIKNPVNKEKTDFYMQVKEKIGSDYCLVRIEKKYE